MRAAAALHRAERVGTRPAQQQHPCRQPRPGLPQSPALNLYYVCVNEGDIYVNGTVEQSYVSCIDTISQRVRRPAQLDSAGCPGPAAHRYTLPPAATEIALCPGRKPHVLTGAPAQFVSRVAVGANPVHLYWLQERAQFWSHSDAEGAFYVLNLANTAVLNTSVPVRPCPALSRALPCLAAAQIWR